MKGAYFMENNLTASNAPTRPAPAGLDRSQERRVIDRTHMLIQRAASLFDMTLPPLPVHFNLKGRAAGMFRIRHGQAEIRYNPWIFARWFEENLAETVPHEVAHYVISRRHRSGTVRPHGPEWRAVMHAFGAAPRATAAYRPEDIADLPSRRMRYFDYVCGCAIHKVSGIRHNRMTRGMAEYFCRKCRLPLRPAPDDSP